MQQFSLVSVIAIVLLLRVPLAKDLHTVQVPYRENAFSETVIYRDIVMFDPHELLSFLWNKWGFMCRKQ